MNAPSPGSTRLVRCVAGLLPLAVAVTLIVAGVSKLLDVPEFLESLSSWSTIPHRVRLFAALAVPCAELTLGMMIVLGISRRIATAAAAVLLGVFTIAIIIQLLRGEMVGCRCFGSLVSYRSTQEAATWMLARNTLLFVASIIATLWMPGDRTVDCSALGG